MINKQISKITLLSAMLLAGVVNAQEFYTCVPKKSWWKDIMTESIKDGQKKIWSKIIDLQITSPLDKFKGWLQPGNYRVTAAAAGGVEEIGEFTLIKTSEFKACVGAGGGNGGIGNWGRGGGAGGGGGGKGYLGAYGGGGGCYGRGGGSGGYGGDGGFGSAGKDGNNAGSGDKSNIAGRGGGVGTTYGAYDPECYFPENRGGKGGGYVGIAGEGGSGSFNESGIGGGGGKGGKGCTGGGGGGAGFGFSNNGTGGGGGGSGGSYFQVADVELNLKGADGTDGKGHDGGIGAGSDGYVIIERLE